MIRKERSRARPIANFTPFRIVSIDSGFSKLIYKSPILRRDTQPRYFVHQNSSHASIVETFDRLRNRANKSEGDTKPLYTSGVQRYFRSPPPEQSHAYSPLKYFMLTLSTLTLFVRDLCLSTVAPYSSARQRRCTLLFSTLRYVTGSCSRPVPESLCTNCARLVAFVAGNVLFRQASFPDVQREFPASATFHRRAGAPPRSFRHRLRPTTATYARQLLFPPSRPPFAARTSRISFRGGKNASCVPLRFSRRCKTRRALLKYVDTTRPAEIFTIGNNVIISSLGTVHVENNFI